MMLCNAAAFALAMAAVSLTPAEDAALKPLVAQWSAARIDRSAPIVVANESLRYDARIEPELRLELLRRGIDAKTAEALIASLRERNAQTAAIDAPSLAGAKRVGIAGDNDLPFVITLAVPGTAGDLGVVFYGTGPRPYHEARVAFVRGGGLEWEYPFANRTFTAAASTPPKFAELTTDQIAIVRALLDSRYPDRAKPLLLVNETVAGGTAIFLPRPELGRSLTMVPRGRLGLVRASELGGAAAVIEIAVPKVRDDGAVIEYREAIPAGEWVVRTNNAATLKRSDSGWSVFSDVTGRPVPTAPDAGIPPLRAGGDVKEPRLIKQVHPQFPPGTRGLVIVEIIVGIDGRMNDIKFLTPVSPEAERIAREALAQWVLEPGTLNGIPVNVIWNAVLP